MSANFVHLSVHSEFSMRDGIVRVADLIKNAADLKMPTVALTDRSNLFATVKLYTKALKAGLKPLVAAELYLFDADNEKQPISTISAFCLNKTGYKHLTELVSTAYLQGQGPGQPTITWSQLVEKNAGLLILSGGCYGNIGQALLANDKAHAEKLLQQWQTVFQDRFYIELQRTQRPNEEDYLHAVLPYAEKYQIPVDRKSVV